jgi:hypothetical protein
MRVTAALTVGVLALSTGCAQAWRNKQYVSLSSLCLAMLASQCAATQPPLIMHIRSRKLQPQDIFCSLGLTVAPAAPRSKVARQLQQPFVISAAFTLPVAFRP